MKITLQKKLEHGIKSITKQITIELADDSTMDGIQEAMLKVLIEGQWTIAEKKP